MMDLNSILFYKGKFQVEARHPEEDLLWVLVAKIRRWMVGKWKRRQEQLPDGNDQWTAWKYGGKLLSARKLVYLESVHHRRTAAEQFWACRIVEAEPSRDGRAPREWTTEIGFQQRAQGSAEISIVLYYSDRPGFIGPCEEPPAASMPKIIPFLLEDTRLRCTVDGHPLSLRATHLRPGDFPAFWETVCDERRTVPVVYISPRRKDDFSGEAETLVEPDRLAGLLGPNALVCYADQLDFSREMSQLCPKDLGCYAGGLRVYAARPRMGEEEDALRHRRLSARRLRALGEEIYGILRRALAQDVHFYEEMFRLEDCRRLNEQAAAEKRRAAHWEALEQQLLETAVEQEDRLRGELEAIAAERAQWAVQEEDLRGQIASLRTDLYCAQQRGDANAEAAEQARTLKAALDQVRALARYPETAEEIADYFAVHYPDRLDFTAQGRESLRDCRTAPEVLWDALYQMVTVLYDLYADECPMVDREFNNRSNLRLARGEGKMTRRDADLMRQYTQQYQGRTIDIETHLKTSEQREGSEKFLRIYFCFDRPTGRLVIGSCGRHLKNYTSLKMGKK